MTALPAHDIPVEPAPASLSFPGESLATHLRIARLAAGAPAAGVYLVHEIPGERGGDVRVQSEGVTEGEDTRAAQLARRVMLSGETIALRDIRPRETSSLDMAFRSFLGVPIGGDDTLHHGCLCVVDDRTREWTAEQIVALQDIASLLERELTSLPMVEERYALQTVVRMLAKAVENMQLGVTITDTSGRIVYTNPADARMHGYTVEELLGRDARVFGPPENTRRRSAEDHARTASWTRETVNVRKDGSRFDVLLWSDLVFDAQGEPIGMVTCCEDITERKRAERALRDVAMRDPLTGLPNRIRFQERLTRAIERQQRDPARRFAVLFLDLDRFKVVNDSLGHHVGDELLRVVATRLLNCVRPGDTVARFGGDEFAVLLEDTGTPETAIEVAQRILARTATPMRLRGHELATSASIGVVRSADHLTDPEYVWQAADMAMYRSKSAGPGQYVVFDQTMHRAAMLRLKLETDLRRAVDRDELRLVYQPVVDLHSGDPVGFEALLRWDHPELGELQPVDFMAVAEETGLIHPLGEWMLKAACRDARAWPAAGDGDAPWLAVNIARKQLGQAGLPRAVEDALAAATLDPARLRLEVAECSLMKSADSVTSVLDELKALGVQLVLDDFGRGFSSISYLHRLPIDSVKIDHSFVEALQTGERQSRLLEGVVLLAQDAGLSVVAEGIETREQLAVLEALGCDQGQGTLFSPPLPPDRITSYLTP